MFAHCRNLLDDFIEETTVDSQHTPWRHFEATDGTQDFIAALEERVSSGKGTTERFAESNRKERPLESEPAITSSIDIITRLPTHDDYPLWRVRCKVTLVGVSFVMSYTYFWSSNP